MAFLIILMAVGVLFILSEILIVPGTVVSGVLGIAALGASCIYAYIEFGAVTGTAVTVSGVLLAVLMTVSMIRAGLRKRLGSDVPKSGIPSNSRSGNPWNKQRLRTQSQPLFFNCSWVREAGKIPC